MVKESEVSKLKKKLNAQINNFEKASQRIEEVVALLQKTLDENNELKKKVEHLESIINPKVETVVKDVVEELVERVVEEEFVAEVVVPEMNDPKEYFDLLILSDSIYRHVGVPVPKTRVKNQPPIYRRFTLCNGSITCLKVVIPGADSARLFEEASVIYCDYEFSEILLHVGANYIPNEHPFSRRPFYMRTAYSEITSCLDAIRNLFEINVTYSPILPQRHSPPGAIRTLNLKIQNFVISNSFNYLFPEKFEDPDAFERLVSRDGIHLSHLGVKSLQAAVETHMSELFMHGIDCELNF